jgi:hypothetical protein
MDGSEAQISYQNDNQTTTSNMGTIDVQRPIYTVPGILHFLQHEWTRFEIERQQWETERAELQVKNYFFDKNKNYFSIRHVSLFFKAKDKDKKI